MSGKEMPHPRPIAILTYHSLDDSGSVLSTPPRVFAEEMRILHELGVRVGPLGEVRRMLGGLAPSESLITITFDDGFKSVYEHGLPVLKQYAFSATVFLVTDYCGKTNSWPGQPGYVERRPLLGWAEVKEMSEEGISFGSHTRTHPDLRTLASHHVEEELVCSKRAIEDAIGRPIEALAYPYGAHNMTAKHLAEQHFAMACSARLGFVRQGADLFALDRLDTFYLPRPAFFRRLFSRELDVYIRLRRKVRDLRGRVPEWLSSSLQGC